MKVTKIGTQQLMFQHILEKKYLSIKRTIQKTKNMAKTLKQEIETIYIIVDNRIKYNYAKK